MKISSIAKYIDQPLIINKISNAAPLVLTGCAAGLGVHDIFQNKKEPTEKRTLKNIAVLTTVAVASLLSARGLSVNGKKIFSGLIETAPKSEILKEQKNVINDFLNKVNLGDEKLTNILEKAKEKALNLKETDYVLKKLNKEEKAQNLLATLFGKKKDLSSSEIFSEIGKLSLLGLIPVVAGVGAGIAIDKGPNKKHNNSDRIKEGFYQYFANILID